MAKIQTISKSAFDQIDGVRQVIAHEYSHKFALLDLGDRLGCYGLSWRSQLVEPIVELSTTQNLVWIGVDQQLAAVCLQSGRIVLAMPLTSNILQILFMEPITAVLTENEILIFNPNGSLRFNHGLPEIPEEVSIVGTKLLIRLIEGESLTLEPQIGVIKEGAIALS
jgi:hypothetical protein